MSYFRNALPVPSYQSFRRLLEGNHRFMRGIRSIHRNSSNEKVIELALKGQSPSSIVLTCSDSRVPVETIFDQGFGDIFVIRVAGNVVSPDIIASVEYAAEQIKVPLCVVMGHTGCGAVEAAIRYNETDETPLSEHGIKLLKKITPSVKKAHRQIQGTSQKLIDSAVLMNTRRNKFLMTRKSQVIRNLISNEKFAVIGAIYDLHTGKVTFDQQKLITSHLEFDPIIESQKKLIMTG